MAKQPLILTEKDILEIDLNLVRLIKDSEARCALLVDQDGLMLARKGFTKEIDCEKLAVLTAASFASTRAMAKLVGEAEFSVLFHQGEKEHIHNTLVDDSTILVVLFDDRTTIGMVRVYAKDVAERIRAILESARATNRSEEDLSGLAGGAGDRLDDMFGGLAEDAGAVFDESSPFAEEEDDISAPRFDQLPTGADDDEQDRIVTQIDVLGRGRPSDKEDTLPMLAHDVAGGGDDTEATLPDMPAQRPPSGGPPATPTDEYTRPTQLMSKVDDDRARGRKQGPPLSFDDTRPPTPRS